jgi:hypothetical protein
MSPRPNASVTAICGLVFACVIPPVGLILSIVAWATGDRDRDGWLPGIGIALSFLATALCLWLLANMRLPMGGG